MTHRPYVLLETFFFKGINLDNIIKDLNLNEDTGKPILGEAVEQLREYANGCSPENSFETIIQEIISECDKVHIMLLHIMCIDNRHAITYELPLPVCPSPSYGRQFRGSGGDHELMRD